MAQIVREGTSMDVVQQPLVMCHDLAVTIGHSTPDTGPRTGAVSPHPANAAGQAGARALKLTAKTRAALVFPVKVCFRMRYHCGAPTPEDYPEV